MEKSFLQNLEKSFLSAKEKIDIQDFLNFVGAHPRLMTFVAGVGISVAFGWMGRFIVHEALATSAAASLSTNPESLHDVPVLQEGSEIKGFPPVIVDDQFKPPAFQEGSEIKLNPPSNC